MWFERQFTFKLGPHLLRGRVDRVDRLPDGEYELIDYKTGRPKSAAQLAEDVQLSLYAVGARESWRLEASRQAYYYLLDDQKVEVPADEGERGGVGPRGGDGGRRGHPLAGLRADAVVSRPARCATTGWCARPPSAEAEGLRRRRGFAAALAQEPLEVAGDRLARRERARGVVGLLAGGLLEALDERLHVGV